MADDSVIHEPLSAVSGEMIKDSSYHRQADRVARLVMTGFTVIQNK